MCIVKWVVISVAVIIFAIMAAGIYKFNFTNDDIFVAQPDGTVVHIDDVEPAVVLKTVDANEFVTKWNEQKGSGAKLIDVRTPGEYAAGHYEGASVIDFYADDFATQLAEFDKGTQYFIYCHSGNRSGQTLRMMQELGFTKVYDLAGGIGGNGNILPIVK